jgi:flagellar biosynthesis/type III secretory pathway chaperone
MENLLKQLLELLGKKQANFQALLQIMRAEKEAVIHNRTEELQQLVSQQETVIKKTAELEHARIKLARGIGTAMGIPGKDPTMSAIIEKIDGPMRAEYKKAYEALTVTLREIENTNKVNSELINSSIDYIKFYTNTLSKAINDNPTYEGSGKINDPLKLRKSIDQAI